MPRQRRDGQTIEDAMHNNTTNSNPCTGPIATPRTVAGAGNRPVTINGQRTDLPVQICGAP